MLRLLPAVAVCLAACSVHAHNCPSDHIDEQVQVTYIYDGDTVKLDDGRRLRFIGIDTPEISHNGKPAQPYAQEAASALARLLAGDARLSLRYDAEREDRYHRQLAHLFLDDGRSVENWLLEQGLATLLTVPPNVWNLSCYQAAERSARAARRGLWSLPRYQPVSSTALPDDAHGFYLVDAQILNVGHSRKAVWLNLSGDLALRIDERDYGYFNMDALEQKVGQHLRVHGWVSARDRRSGRDDARERNLQRRGLLMPLRHPVQLEWLP